MHVRGVDLAVRESGEGSPFFWGHGLTGSMAQEDDAGLLDWAEIARVARLLRYDARGHGRSEATLDPAGYRWPELARDLLALADACGAERSVLGGVSMGCATALHAAVAAPKRLEGLVLMAPPTAWRTRPRQARVYRLLAGLTERVGLSPFVWLTSLGRFAPGSSPAGELQRAMTKHLRRAARRCVVAALRGAAISDLPEPDALRALEVPALVLAWHGDPAHPISTAEELVKLLPRADLRVVRTLDEAHAWSSQVCDFLAGLGRSGSTRAPASRS